MHVYVGIEMRKEKFPFQGVKVSVGEAIKFSDIPNHVCPYCGQSPYFKSQPDTYLIKCDRCGRLS